MAVSSLIARRESAALKTMREVRILLIEDSKSDVFLVERMLEEASMNCFYNVTDVPRLIDAFTIMDKEKFDLVMLDLNLVDINGVASVAALKAQAPYVPIVVYSGMDDASIKEKSLMCGANHYLVKGKESIFGLKHMIERAIA